MPVDGEFRTSVPNIYAIGDVKSAQGFDPKSIDWIGRVLDLRSRLCTMFGDVVSRPGLGF